MKSDAQPLVSVVSLTHNRCQDILELLAALQQQEYQSLEIIVVDNDSCDGTTGEVSKRFPQVNLIQNQTNGGVGAYNIGMQRARGEYILLIDDDGLPVRTDWAKRLVSCFESNPNLGAVACRVRLSANGKLAPDDPQHLLVRDDFDGFPCPAFVCTGAAVRAEALQEVGYFPQFFFMSYLEFAFSAKLWNAGWQVRYFPDIEVFHKKSPTAYRQNNREQSYWGLRSYYWFIWMLYPWPAVLEETFHHALHTLRLALGRHGSLRVWLCALSDAIRGCSKAKRKRQPISPRTLGWLHQLRGHRRPSFFSEVRWSQRT